VADSMRWAAGMVSAGKPENVLCQFTSLSALVVDSFMYSC